MVKVAYRRPVGLAALLVAALLVLGASAGRATPVKEAPLPPAAAAYRATLFLADLAPVPWDRIAAAWEAPYPGAASPRPAADAVTPEAAAAVTQAIAAQDRDAIFAAATRALAQAITARLDAAEEALATGDAAAPLAEARGLFRGFEDGIAAADPEASRRLGLAWLELTSAAGSRGVLGAGEQTADADTFARARAEIAGYLAAEFAPAAFTPRDVLQPIPESAAAAGRAVDVPPWLPPGSNIADQSPLPRLVLNFEQQGIDEVDLPLVAYGDMLFDSPRIFGEPARSLGIACSTCHNRSDVNQAFFIPGTAHRPGTVDVDGAYFNPLFNDLRDDPLDIPSLRGLRFTGPYGRDGRMASLRDFVRNVIVSEFGGDEPSPFELDALVAYLLEFDFLPNSKLGTDGRLTEAASDAARRGEAIFNRRFAGMDGMACATCHIPSANFLDRRAHDIGSAAPGYDGDRSGAFDTPTLLGAKFSAPYMHDGALPTLASVVDWFEGRYALGLGEAERGDLTAYLEAVGDADEPWESFDERNTSFRLAFEELTTFASALDTLIPRQDADHALLLIDTVSRDLAADASTMANLEAKPEVYALAEALGGAGAAIRAGDWAGAATAWDEFKALQAEVDARMF